MKIAYLGIDLLLEVFDSLLKEDCEIIKVFTCPADNKTEFNIKTIAAAKSEGIPYTLERVTNADLVQLKNMGCQLIVCAAYYFKVPVSADIPMVNFHPSYLPAGRGAWPMPIIILNKLKYGGITIHKMAEDFDTGDILIQKKFKIESNETLQSYMQKVYAKIPALVHTLISRLPSLLKNAVKQTGGQYWPMPNENDWTVTADMDADTADTILRAFYGYECIYSSKGKRFELINGKVIKSVSKNKPFSVKGGYIRADYIKEL